MNTENSETNESNKFVYQFTDKLSIKNPNENIGLVNLSIYYTWKNSKSAHNNSRFKILASTSNDEFDLPDGSYSISDMRLQQIILLCKFMYIKSKAGSLLK